MVQHVVDGLEVLFALIVQLLGLGLQLLEAAFRVYVDGILRVLSNVELVLECLRRLPDAYVSDWGKGKRGFGVGW